MADEARDPAVKQDFIALQARDDHGFRIRSIRSRSNFPKWKVRARGLMACVRVR